MEKELKITEEELENLVDLASKTEKYTNEYYDLKGKFESLGLNMVEEVEKRNTKLTEEFIKNNPDVVELIDTATKYLLDAIENPYSNSNKAFLGVKAEYQRAKNEEFNRKKLTEETKEKFEKSITYIIADEIRKNGVCVLKADEFTFEPLTEAIDAADLRGVYFPKMHMEITEEGIKVKDSFDKLIPLEKEEESSKSM